MKKIIFIISAFVVAVAITAGIYYHTKTIKVSVEEIIPADPIAYVRVRDIANSWEELKTTHLWKTIKDIDIEMLMRESGLPQEQITQFAESKSTLERFELELLLTQLFGEEVALALYLPKSGQEAKEILDAVPEVVLLTRLNSKMQLVEFVSNIGSKFNKQFKISNAEYRGYQVSKVELGNGINISYAKIKDFLAVSLVDKPIHACIDTITKNNDALSGDKAFQSVKRKLHDETNIMGYANFQKIKPNLEAAIKNNEFLAKQQDKLQGSLGVLGFSSYEGQILEHRFVLILEEDNLDPVLVKMYSLKSEPKHAMGFIPQGTLLYQWNNLLNAEYAWEDIKQEAPEDDLAEMEAQIGLSIEQEVLPVLGTEFGGFVYDIELNNFFPVPKIAVFLSVKDQAIVEKVITGLLEGRDLSLKSKDHEGISIKYVELPMVGALTPGFCFIDNYLLIASTSELLEASIDSSSGKLPSLVDSDKLEALNVGLTSEVSDIFFVNTALLSEKLKKLGEWAIGWMSFLSASADTYRVQLQQSAMNLMEVAKGAQADLQALINKGQQIKQAIENLKTQGDDVSSKEAELAQLVSEITKKRQELVSVQQELQQTHDMIVKVEAKSPAKKIALTELYLNKVVFPLLDSLKIVKSSCSKVVFQKGVLEVKAFHSIEQ